MDERRTVRLCTNCKEPVHPSSQQCDKVCPHCLHKPHDDAKCIQCEDEAGGNLPQRTKCTTVCPIPGEIGVLVQAGFGWLPVRAESARCGGQSKP